MILKLILTVSFGPVIVPIHLNKFSPSGKADTPCSVLIMSTISSFCNLNNKERPTDKSHSRFADRDVPQIIAQLIAGKGRIKFAE